MVQRLADCLGRDFRRESQLTFETVTGKLQRRFVHIPSGLLIEAFELTADPHDQERFARRTETVYADRPAWFPSPEDIVVQKIRWLGLRNRAKDRRDVLHVIRRQRETLDWPYIERWCREHGTLDLLGQLRREADVLLE